MAMHKHPTFDEEMFWHNVGSIPTVVKEQSILWRETLPAGIAHNAFKGETLHLTKWSSTQRTLLGL